MATQTDKVVVESIWKLQDYASGPAKAMANHFNLLGNQIRMTNGHLRVTQTLMGTAAFAGAAYGSFRLAKSVVNANYELEKMKYGIGAILLQSQKLGYIPGNKYKDMSDSLKEAEGVYQRLYVYAQKAVGTADDYTSAWRDIAMSVSRAGGGIAEIERVAQLIVPLSKQLGLIPENAYRDIQQYLTGRMTVRDVVPRMIGLGNDPNYSKMTDAQRLSKLIAALETGREGAKAYEKTFEAQFDTFKSLLVQIQREGGKGFFDQVKADMSEFNQEFLGNEKEIYEYSRRISQEMTEVYTDLKNAAIFAAENFDTIYETTKEIVKLWISMKIAGAAMAGIKSIAGLFGQFTAWGGAAKLASDGLSGLKGQLWAIGPAIGAATLTVAAAIRAWYQVIEDSQSLKNTKGDLFEMEQQKAAYALRKSHRPGYEMPGYEMSAIDAVAAQMAEDELKANWKEHVKYRLFNKPVEPSEDFRNANYDYLKLKHWNVLMAKYLKKSPVEPPADASTEKPKDVNINNDFRGSRINITVDSRHADPNRVAATVISALGRAAKSRTGSKMGLAGSQV